MSVTNRKIKTSHADIAFSETSGGGLPVLFIHGNSSCKEVFRRQLESPIGDTYHLIAIDLPGHGASSDAFEPERSYTMPGYADAAVETLALLGVQSAVVFGWSLGGHVALEMIPRFGGLVGLMITGAPPVGRSPEEIQAGFRPTPHIGLAGKPEFTAEDVEIFAVATCGQPVDPVLRQAIVRTDGRARGMMFASLFAGQASDQRKLAENSPVPIAVVNGTDDPLVNLAYVNGLSYRNLWDNHCYVLRGAGHASFLQAPEAFNAIVTRFLGEMAKRGTKSGGGRSKVAAA